MQRAPDPIESDLSLTEDPDGGGVFVKWHRVPLSGTMLPQHSHTYAHVSVIAGGSVTVWEEGDLKGTYHAPASLVIPAGKKHSFLTLVDDTIILCVHRSDFAVLEEHQIIPQSG
jgi:hypothetical protein